MSGAVHRIRSLNLGIEVDPAAPGRMPPKARRFFDVAGAMFEDAGLALRTRRVTSQPCAG